MPVMCGSCCLFAGSLGKMWLQCSLMQNQLGKHVYSPSSGLCTMRCCCRQARQASLQAEEGAVAAAADKQQDTCPQAAAAAVASTAAEDAGGEGRDAVAAEPAGPQPDSQAPGGDGVAAKGRVPTIVCQGRA